MLEDKRKVQCIRNISISKIIINKGTVGIAIKQVHSEINGVTTSATREIIKELFIV